MAEKAVESPTFSTLVWRKESDEVSASWGRKLRNPSLSPLLSREKESDEVSASWGKKLRNPPLSPLLSRDKKAMRFLLHGGKS